ncbi:MAG: FAD-dependent oxidoreductase [Desulfobacterales bacterium]|nr:FAD-dependent oxidoreductase [Desulfobacterales bacterium]
MVIAFIIMGALGLIIGIGLAIASKVFYVFIDPKIEAVEQALPGANCGGCGLPGCSANAEAIVAGKSSASSCVAGGPDIAIEIAKIMGVAAEAKEPDIARPGCYYGPRTADLKYLYEGINDCRAAALISGGMKVCTIGCLGLGTCAKACPFNAITMGAEGLPVVDEVKCTGCGTCERVCPKHIITLSSVTRRILREYTTEECTTPCQRSCPAGINIREYIRQIETGNYHRAVQVIKERNPFPAIIGRICPRPCETDCRRKFIDEPVAINFLKRYAADFEKESGKRILPAKAPDTGRKIAVIGGGIEGLSAAFFTARLGHNPTVFEATPRLGGLLNSAISSYRLPHEILDWDLGGIIAMGVDIRTDTALGKNLSLDALFRQGFDGVYLSTGGWDSRLARDPGTHVEMPVTGLTLLVDLIKLDQAGGAKPSFGPEVVIAGGGRLALKAAGVLKKLGAQKITILFREPWDHTPVEGVNIRELEEDGIEIIAGSGIDRIFGEADRLCRVRYLQLDTLSEKTIPAQALVLASGRFPNFIFVKSQVPPDSHDTDAPVRWEAVESYKRPEFSKEIGLFAKGDLVTDYTAAIKAIAGGRRGAVTIHQMMYGIEPKLSDQVITSRSRLQDVDHVENVPAGSRQLMPLCAPKDLAACKEMETGFTEDMAHTEAARCLQCGLICYRKIEAADHAAYETSSPFTNEVIYI